MIDLLIDYTVTISAVCLVLLCCHALLLKWLGPRTLYSLWIITPIAALLNPLSNSLSSMLITILTAIGLTEPTAPTQLVAYVSVITSQLDESMGALRPLVLGIWLLGFIAMLFLLIQDLVTLHRGGHARLGQLRVQRSYRISSPGVFGVVTPTIQLPSDFSFCYSRTERLLILQHELMHWQRGDTRVNLLAWLLLGSQWFNPILWLAYRRFRADQELACDADVLEKHGTHLTSSYSKALVKTTTHPSMQRERGPFTLSPCSTHYGYQQGSFTMMKERLINLQHRRVISRFPAAIASLIVVALATLWNLPAHSQTGQSSAETQPPVGEAADDKPLVPIVRIEPRYPEHAVKEGIEGHVDLAFKINSNGETTDIKVIDSKPAGVFDEVVVEALERWRYAPQANKPMKIRIAMTIK